MSSANSQQVWAPVDIAEVRISIFLKSEQYFIIL